MWLYFSFQKKNMMMMCGEKKKTIFLFLASSGEEGRAPIRKTRTRVCSLENHRTPMHSFPPRSTTYLAAGTSQRGTAVLFFWSSGLVSWPQNKKELEVIRSVQLQLAKVITSLHRVVCLLVQTAQKDTYAWSVGQNRVIFMRARF